MIFGFTPGFFKNSKVFIVLTYVSVEFMLEGYSFFFWLLFTPQLTYVDHICLAGWLDAGGFSFRVSIYFKPIALML